MGATRGRLIRQLLTESLLLASVARAAWGHRRRAVGKSAAAGPYAGHPMPLDWRVLAFVARR
jgi:hypothetical protein